MNHAKIISQVVADHLIRTVTCSVQGEDIYRFERRNIAGSYCTFDFSPISGDLPLLSHSIKQELSMNYTLFSFNLTSNYCTVAYLPKDLINRWEEISKEIHNDC